MLETQGLHFQYQDGPSFDFPDIKCGAKDHLLLLGGSGKGKTTLLHLLAGLLSPHSGSVSVQGHNMAQLTGKALDQFRGKHIGIVYQTAHFVESLNVEDNLILPQYLTGRSIDRSKARKVLSRLQLEHKLKAAPRNLSIGEKQRVAIARALMNSPQLILADEPTSALDDENADEVIRLLEEQSNLEGASLVIVTHDQRLKDQFEKRVEL